MRPLRGKVHNAIKRSTERCGGTHLQLQTKLKLQKTGDNTNITKLPNRILQQALKLDLPSTKRWQLKQKTASKLKRSPPQLAGPEKKTKKKLDHTVSKNNHHWHGSRRNYDEWGCWKHRIALWLSLGTSLTLKKHCGPGPALHKQLQ